MFSQLSGQTFEDCLKIGHKDRCKLICAVDAYDISWPYNGSSGGGIPLTLILSTDSLESIGPTIRFIDNWLQCFENNYGEKHVYIFLIDRVV